MLLYELQSQVKKLFIYIILRQEDQTLEFSSVAVKDYYKSIASIFMSPYELNGLSGTQIIKMITKSIQLRGEEVTSMGVDECIEAIKNIDNRMLKAIIDKTEGNVMMILEFFNSLIKAKYIEKIDGRLTGTNEFRRAVELDNWLSIPVPDFGHRLTSHYFSKANSMYFLISNIEKRGYS